MLIQVSFNTNVQSILKDGFAFQRFYRTEVFRIFQCSGDHERQTVLWKQNNSTKTYHNTT
jgi:hypothetical protein